MPLDTLPKHSEFTYGVNRSIATAVINNNAFTLMQPNAFYEAFQKLDEGVMGARRSLIAEKESLRQGIAYTLPYRMYIVDKQPKLKFMVYKRTKANADGGIVNKLSMGAGGHIETCDVELHTYIENSEVLVSQAIDLKATTENSLAREVSEEVACYDEYGVNIVEAVLGLESLDTYQGIGFVMDSAANKGYVGNIHFGAVYALEIPKSITRVEMTEPQNKMVGFFDADELIEMLNGEDPFEPWSEYIVKQIKVVEQHILDTFYDFVDGDAKLDTVENEPWDSETFNNVTQTEPTSKPLDVVETPAPVIKTLYTPLEVKEKLESIIQAEWTKLNETPYMSEEDFVRILASNIKVNVVDALSKVLQAFTVKCVIKTGVTTVEAIVGFEGKEYEFTMTFP